MQQGMTVRARKTAASVLRKREISVSDQRGLTPVVYMTAYSRSRSTMLMVMALNSTAKDMATANTSMTAIER